MAKGNNNKLEIMKAKKISFEEANALFRYDPDTGQIWWKERGLGRQFGKPVGTLNSRGYIRLRVNKGLLLAHRIAYLLYYGAVPTNMQVDHINHITYDNRIKNLRLVSHSENQRNMSISRDSATGVTGVYYNTRRKKYIAQIAVHGEVKYLGCFNTLEEAAEVRRQANKEYDFHRNHGK